jgi:hypothetical protein
MPSKEALRAEVAMLRAELEAMRRARNAQPIDEDDDDEDDNDDLDLDRDDLGLDDDTRRKFEAQLKEIRAKVANLAEDARDEITDRPLVAVLGAFAIGLIVGRLTKR